MTVSVRGRVPRDKDGKFAEHIAAHIQERLQALERALAGGAPQFTSPGTPAFGSGPIVATGGGGGTGGSGSGGTTTVVNQTVDDDWSSRFLLMGA